MSLPYSPLIIRGEAPNTIHGSVVANQVAYGSGVNTLTSSPNFLFDGSTFSLGGTALSSAIFIEATHTFTPATGTPLGLALQIESDPTADGTSFVTGFIRGIVGGTHSVSSSYGTQMGIKYNGSGAAFDVIGGVFEAIQNGTGAITDAFAASTQRLIVSNTGVITTAVHQLFSVVQVTGGGTIQNLYGVYSNPMTAGTVSNFFLYYANGGSGYYVTGDGKLGIGEPAPTSKLQVPGLQIFANNAAAVGGGLTVGAFYRTGGDPDTVCVVH